MSSRNTIQDELRSLNSGLPVTNSPSFSVPESYFEGLAAIILAKIKSSEVSTHTELDELSPLLAGIPKVTPYSVPSSFFEENLRNISLIGDETESPILAVIGQEIPYEVPVGYFENFPAQVLAKVSIPKAKVVPLFARTWMRTAAAAVVGGALILGGLQIFSGKQNTNSTASQAVDTASAYVAQTKPAPVQAIKKASTKDLEDFIENVPVTASSPKKEPASKEEAQALLKDVSVNEMENFLAAVPQADDELAATDVP